MGDNIPMDVEEVPPVVTPSVPTAEELTDESLVHFKRLEQGHAVVEAVAGAGKSYKMQEILKTLGPDEKVLMIVFNKENCKSFKKDIQGKHRCTVTVKTIHSFGFMFFPRKGEVDGKAHYKSARKKFTRGEVYGMAVAVGNLISKVQNIVCKWEDVNEQWISRIMDTFEIGSGLPDMIKLQIVQTAIDILEEVRKDWTRDRTPYTSFDDMIWLPVIMNWEKLTDPSVYDWIFVDEAQDLCDVQIKILSKILLKSPKARVFVAGDTNQTIYSFRGAYNAMAKIRALLKGPKEFLLPVCRRCPVLVLNLARIFVPYIKPLESAVVGEIRQVQYNDAINQINKGDIVLCRQTKPVIGLAFQLLHINKPAVVVGEVTLKHLISSFFKNNQKIFETEEQKTSLKIVASNEFDKMKEKLLNDFDGSRIGFYEDLLLCINNFIDNCSSDIDVVKRMGTIFFPDPADDTQRGKKGKENRNELLPQSVIKCSTIHRSKGSTIENVWILTAPYDESISIADLPVEERNIWYVALTRASKTLNIVECPEIKRKNSKNREFVPNAAFIPKELKDAIQRNASVNN